MRVGGDNRQALERFGDASFESCVPVEFREAVEIPGLVQSTSDFISPRSIKQAVPVAFPPPATLAPSRAQETEKSVRRMYDQRATSRLEEEATLVCVLQKSNTPLSNETVQTGVVGRHRDDYRVAERDV